MTKIIKIFSEYVTEDELFEKSKLFLNRSELFHRESEPVTDVFEKNRNYF